MLRDHWQFDYSAAQLTEATQAQIAHHQERIQFWRITKDQVIATIRAEGIEVDEKLVLAYASPKSRDWEDGGEIMIRNDLRKRLAECFKKLAYHTGWRDTYFGWKQLLDANPESRMPLEIDDWLFFFGKDTGRD